MSYLNRLQENWESLAKKDPLWAVCTDPIQKGRKWDIDALYKTGEEEVAAVLDRIKKAGLTVDAKSPLLDFGCGVGRLTQAFAKFFEICYDVDISSTMIGHAQHHNRYPQRCFYHVNERDDLKLFHDDFFGFIYTSLVLQHMKPALSIVYLKEFARLLKPGGIAVVQIIDHDNLTSFQHMRRTIRLRTRVRAFIEEILLKKSKKEPAIPMYCLPEKKVRTLAKEIPFSVIDVVCTNSADKDFNGKLRYLNTPAPEGYVSKQYIFAKQ